jgi:hypothetical protein
MQATATSRGLLWSAAVLATVFGAPASVRAQERLEPVVVTATSNARADSLLAQAITYQDSLRHLDRAARLHEQSAALRSADDPQTAKSLRSAAANWYYYGDRSRARDDMEHAARQAMARGDVMTAANAYVDAAVIAAELGQAARVADLGRKGEILISSPLLTPEQRTALRDRVTRGHEVAMALLGDR